MKLPGLSPHALERLPELADQAIRAQALQAAVALVTAAPLPEDAVLTLDRVMEYARQFDDYIREGI